MKNRIKLLLIAGLLLQTDVLSAQDIRITSFGQNPTSLIAKMNPMTDNAGNDCAVIRFYVRGEASAYNIEPNLGTLKQESLSGEIRVWVPKSTKRLTIRHTNSMPLIGYKIPINLESKRDYEAVIEVNRVTQQPIQYIDNGWSNNGEEAYKNQNKNHIIYAGAGFNALSIMGPSIVLGCSINHHSIELGAVYGLNKTDDWYYYDNSGSVTAAYNYQAIRVQLRYGYEIQAADFLGIMPQLGVAYNILNGKTVNSVTSSSNAYKNANSISAFAALRLVANFSETIKLHITPEYDFGVYKDNTCKLIADKDNKFKSWTDGFNLNVGLIIYF